MELGHIAAVLLRRWRWIAVAVVLCAGAAVLVTQRATPQYRAVATLYVSAPTSSADVASQVQGNQLSQQLVTSYAQLVPSKPVAAKVAEDLGITATPEALLAGVTAAARPSTTLIDVYATSPDPKTAADLANAFGDAFAEQVVGLERSTSGQPSAVKVTVYNRADIGGKISPKTRTDIALGLALGLLLGVAAALLREAQDKSVKTPDEARAAAGVAVLGTITFDASTEAQPLVVVANPKAPRAEAYRQLRTNIQFVGVDGGLQSVVVTSAVPNEGKSTTSCNLAVALAQSGRTVILVEGDLRKPSVREYMGIEGAVGLTNVLIGQAELDDVLQPWGDGQLQVLPAGPTPPNPSELLGSHAMELVLEQLHARADIVVFDAPPLLPVTDGAVLASLTKRALLVVRAGSTTHDQVKAARELLDNVGARPVGVVLNMASTKRGAAYGYGYGYGYGLDSKNEVTTDTLAGLPVSPLRKPAPVALVPAAEAPPVQAAVVEPPRPEVEGPPAVQAAKVDLTRHHDRPRPVPLGEDEPANR